MNNAELRKRMATAIRELRGSETQVEFARRCGLAQTDVSDWETGRRMPGAATLIKIREATGADLIALLGGSKIETKDD